MLKQENKVSKLQEELLKGYNVRITKNYNNGNQKEYLSKELQGIGKGVLDLKTLRKSIEEEENERGFYEGEELNRAVRGYVRDVLSTLKNVVCIVEESDRDYLTYLYFKEIQFIVLEEDFNVVSL